MSIEVIAEIGVCHNGNFETACRLVAAAHLVGCDTVKTQLWNSERVYGDRAAEMKKLELSREQIKDLKEHVEKWGMEFLCTPDEIEDAEYLAKIGCKRIKTSSQDVTNLPFLSAIEQLGLPVIYSTGACTGVEMLAGFRVLTRGTNHVTVLHCVSAYPTPLHDMNLRALTEIRKRLRCPIGLSDHTLGEDAAVMALALGATVFEKHLTLDKNQIGPDHSCSMEPIEMAQYIHRLRECERALGDGVKRIMPCEIENRKRYDAFIAPRKESKC